MRLSQVKFIVQTNKVYESCEMRRGIYDRSPDYGGSFDKGAKLVMFRTMYANRVPRSACL